MYSCSIMNRKVGICMRNINVEDFIAKVVVSKVDTMLEKSNIITPRIIKNANLAKIFGI